MARLRLVVWMAATGAAAVALLEVPVLAADDPAGAAMAVVRAVAGVLAAYLFVATLAAAVRIPFAWRLSPAFVRRLVAGAVGGGLLLTPVAASAEVRERPPAEAPVLRRVPGTAPEPAVPAVPADPEAATTPAAPGTVVVAPGDHLWAIAERTLSARLGRAPSDGEVVPYWAALIAANRPRLANPDDANLIFPGQTFVLP